MTKRPWIPAPCKTSASNKQLVCNKRFQSKKQQLIRHRKYSLISENSVDLCSNCCCNIAETETLRSSKFAVDFSAAHLLIEKNLNEIEILKSALLAREKDIVDLTQEIEIEQNARISAENNCGLLAEIIEKLESLNDIQKKQLDELEIRSPKSDNTSVQGEEDAKTFVNTEVNTDIEFIAIDVEKVLTSTKSTQISQNSSKFQSVQTNNFQKTSNVFVQTSLEKSTNRAVQTDESLFSENSALKYEIKIKHLKEKLKKRKEKIAASRLSPMESKVKEIETTLDDSEKLSLTSGLRRLNAENKKVKEVFGFVKDAYNVLFMDEEECVEKV